MIIYKNYNFNFFINRITLRRKRKNYIKRKDIMKKKELFYNINKKNEKKKFNRWIFVPPCVLIHISIGSVYAWSVLNTPLTKELGILISTTNDFTFSNVLPVMSTAFSMMGITAACLGKLQEKIGVRICGSIGASCFGGGLILGGLGIHFHKLSLLYLGYGIFGGAGVGISYLPPISALIKWFPDKKGMATGMAIMGFGGAGIIATPIMEILLTHFSQPPIYVGSTNEVAILLKEGKKFVKIDGLIQMVTIPTKNEIELSQFSELNEGVYLVGTGKTGVAECLIVMGSGYLPLMLISTWFIQVPPTGYLPSGFIPSSIDIRDEDAINADQALRTSQFWTLWGVFTCIATTGMGIISIAKTMIKDIFGGILPHVVTETFASTYVVMISIFNLGGRIIWASISDKLGRKNTFSLFSIFGTALFLMIPPTVDWVINSVQIAPLLCFYVSTMLIFSFFGGTFSCIPAYEADIFGSKNVGSIHGRMLTGTTVSSFAGPMTLATLRSNAEKLAIHDLVKNISSSDFKNSFGEEKNKIESLIKSRICNIQNLLDLCPNGTEDPTPFLYDSTFYTMAGLMAISAGLNLLIRPPRTKQDKLF